MNEPKMRTAASIHGHMIVLGTGHSIAIYKRNGADYVAEPCGRVRELSTATWFRFYAGALRYRHNERAALQSSIPLNPEMLQIIERLHAGSEARQERVLALPRTVGAAGQRYWTNVTLRLRGGATKMNQTFG